MKIQCDVCSAEEALVFCCADEAALCGRCDRGIHSANKLAGKHLRFSLLNPSSSNCHASPLCDICQEKRGVLFCQEDRAILCRDCDVPIHNTNSQTMKHSRFLLTGIMLSSVPIAFSNGSRPPYHHRHSGSPNSDNSIIIDDQDQKIAAKLQEEGVLCTATGSCSSTNTAATTTMSDNGNSSSISEYLIKLLPGWHVEDFLFDDATTNAAPAPAVTTTISGSYNKADEMLLPSVERGRNSELSSYSVAADGLPIRVPGYFDEGIVHEEKEVIIRGNSSRQKRWNAKVYMVPEFHSSGVGVMVGGGYSSNKKRHRNSSFRLAHYY